MHPTERLLIESNRALRSQDYGAALRKANEVLTEWPDCQPALFIAGMVMIRGGDYGLALPYFERCTRLAPDSHEAWNNLGACLQDRHPARAEAAFRRALEINAAQVDAMSNMCAVAAAQGRLEESIEWAEKCLALDQMNADAIYNSSLSMFSLGRYKEGFARYKASLGLTACRKERNYHADRPTPRWDGKASDGAVVIYGEQGLGDQILFASMLKDAIAVHGRIIIETSPRLAPLFSRSFPGVTVFDTLGEDECSWPSDYRISAKLEMGGLGEFFMPSDQRRFGPYLSPDPARVAAWRTWLEHKGRGPYIGVAWNAGILDTGRSYRSIKFESMGDLLDHEATWVSLEYRDDRDARHENLVHPELWNRGPDYDDTAALVAALDRVVAPTTSVVDLAAAIGTPVDVLCPVNPPWRYGEAAGEDRMFFYDAPRVFRQEERGLWAPVLKRVKQSLTAQ